MNIQSFDLNKHNVNEIALLIYETDKNLFSTFLDKNPKKAVKKLEKLILAGNNCYGKENLYITENQNGEIRGIIVAFRGDEIKFINEAKIFKNTMNFFDFLKLTFVKPVYDKITASSIEYDDFYIGNLVVAPDFRGQGIGTELLKISLELARAKNCKRVLLDVLFENERAKNLYDRLGFKVCSEKSFKWIGKDDGTYGMEYFVDE